MLTEYQVIKILCAEYGIEKENLFTTKRISFKVDDAKKHLVKWYRDVKLLGLHDIQKKIGFKIEATIMWNIKKADNYIETDAEFQRVWFSICGNIPMRNRKQEPKVLTLLCSYFQVTKESLKLPSHIPKITNAKQLLVKWYKDVGGLSYPQIARKMCYADHTSGMHAYNRANEVIDTEPRIKKHWYKLPGVDVFPHITAMGENRLG